MRRPLLPAWRDPTGQGRDSLGRSTSPEELTRVADQAPAAVREVEAQKSYLRGAYRDPDQAGDTLDKLIERFGCDLRAAAQTLREEGPEVLGPLRGREGWLAGRAAQDERTRARSAAVAIGGSLDREAAARDAAVRHHTGEVEQQRARDAVEVPGLSKAALDTLKAVQMAGLTAEIPREGERYDARQRRREELVSAAWREGRADPRVANELDGFMAAASQRLGEEGMRNASRAASSGRYMTVPGVGREHQAGLDELARSFIQAREGVTLSKDWGRRVEREAQETERQPARAEERERRGLAREPEQDRERQRERAWAGAGAGEVNFEYRKGCVRNVRGYSMSGLCHSPGRSRIGPMNVNFPRFSADDEHFPLARSAVLAAACSQANACLPSAEPFRHLSTDREQ